MDLQDQIKETEPWKYYECHKKYSEKQLDMICHQYEIRLAGMRKYQKKKYNEDSEYKKYCQEQSKKHYKLNKEKLAELYLLKKKEKQEENTKKWEAYQGNVEVIVNIK